MKVVKLFWLAILPSIFAQNQGTLKEEQPLPMTIERCTGQGQCSQESVAVTLDANWRWTHEAGAYKNCYEGNQWDSALCPDEKACAENCAIDGVPQNDWASTYGVQSSGKDLTLKFVTVGPFSTNIGSRLYLLDSSKEKYKMFSLLNKEFTVDIDSSTLDCGLNGALYLVEMDPDGGLAAYPGNKAGAAYGTGYCDAQCPHDIKWINGEANIIDWQTSPNDPNAGFGHYGACCAEMDLWEANKQAQAYTSHPCDTQHAYRCEGVECGDNASGDRYNGVCDKDGCDFASYRMGDKSYYGPGSQFPVDSSKPVTVVTQFITDDGTDNGNLAEIRRVYLQNGQVIQNSHVNHNGVSAYDSITDEFCSELKVLFGDTDDHAEKGGLRVMGEALKRGMVLVMSLWDDHDAHMLWLDSNFPPDGNPNTPGVARGPCSTDSGKPEDVESQQASATVKFGNIKYGPIGSTYPH